MRRVMTALLAVFAAACSEQVTLPRQFNEVTLEMQFLQFSDSALANMDSTASFWAVYGAERKLIMRYADTGKEYLRFEVEGESLANWPDGAPFQPGDSVLITVDVDPLGRWAFHFSPSGLTFNPALPALLTLSYERVDEDVDVDGDIDSLDMFLVQQPTIWKRDLPTVPWEPLPTQRPFARVVRAHVYDFTDFGLAID